MITWQFSKRVGLSFTTSGPIFHYTLNAERGENREQCGTGCQWAFEKYKITLSLKFYPEYYDLDNQSFGHILLIVLL